MAEKWEAKDKLKPKGLDGISDQQIEYHFETHYKGYVNKLQEHIQFENMPGSHSR